MALGYDQKIKDFVLSLVDASYNPLPTDKQTFDKAMNIADVSRLPKTYKITRAVDFMGVKALVADNLANDQKVAYIDGMMAGGITKEDILSNNLQGKLKNILTKANNPLFKVQDVAVREVGMFNALDQYVPYAKVAIKTAGKDNKNYEGIIGAVKDDNSNGFILSVNDEGKYNQKVAEDFYKDLRVGKDINSSNPNQSSGNQTIVKLPPIANTTLKQLPSVNGINPLSVPRQQITNNYNTTQNPQVPIKCICK
ncbi:MAG: hypothetical protein WCK67_12385 [bacterium]